VVAFLIVFLIVFDDDGHFSVLPGDAYMGGLEYCGTGFLKVLAAAVGKASQAPNLQFVPAKEGKAPPVVYEGELVFTACKHSPS